MRALWLARPWGCPYYYLSGRARDRSRAFAVPRAAVPGRQLWQIRCQRHSTKRCKFIRTVRMEELETFWEQVARWALSGFVLGTDGETEHRDMIPRPERKP